jgi:hypothetical protein
MWNGRLAAEGNIATQHRSTHWTNLCIVTKKRTDELLRLPYRMNETISVPIIFRKEFKNKLHLVANNLK